MSLGIGIGLALPRIRRGGAAPDPAVTLSATQTSGPAPLGVFFEATATGFGVSRPKHDLRYKWTFGTDTGSWQTPNRLVDSDKNVAYGPWTVHTFASDGSYTVTCEVTDGVSTVSETVDITVSTVAAHFGTDIAVVSQDGDFTGAPAGSTQFTDWETAMGFMRSGPPPVDGYPAKALLLRAGETFDYSTVSTSFSSFAGLYVGAFGSGARPIVDVTGQRLYFESGQGPHCFTDLDLRGPYDSVTGTNEPNEQGFAWGSMGSHPITLHNCRSDGVRILINGSTGAPVISEYEGSDWLAFGVALASVDQGGMVGCKVNMEPDTSTGPGGRENLTEPKWCDHGPYRDSDAGRFSFRQCEMFSKAGWSDAALTDGLAHQQCLRLQSEGGSGGAGMIERCVLEGGISLVNCFANAPPKVNSPQDYIFEKNLMLGTANTQAFIDVGFGGTTIRNNIMIMPNAVHEHNGFITWIGTPASGGGSTADNADDPILVYNNTFVDLRSNTTAPGATTITLTDHVSDGFQEDYTVTYSNNIVHQPNLTSPNVPADPLVESPALVPPLYVGEWFDGSFDVTHVTPSETAASFKPLAGSAAIDGAGSGKVALDDFAGTLRGGTAYLGAWEETGTAGSDATAPTLSSVVDAQSSTVDTEMDGSVDTTEAGRIWWVLTSSATAPSAAQVKAAQDHTGSTVAAAQRGLVVATGSGTVPITTEGLSIGTTYYLHCVQDDLSGNTSAVASGSGFTPADTTAPVLSAATDATDGSSAMTGSVTTDEGNGTLYYVITQSATSPSAAQVKAGNDHTGSAADASGNQAVSATGSQAISASGLSASTTYYAHYMHEDSAANQSAVASADGFTTEAATFTVVASETHLYEPANVVGSGTATGWTDSVGAGDMVVVSSGNTIDGDGGLVYSAATSGLAWPEGNAPSGSTIYLTIAFAANSVTAARVLGAASFGGHILYAEDTSASAGYDGFWSNSRTLYSGGSTYSNPTRDRVHTEIAAQNVVTIAFNPTSQWNSNSLDFIPFGIITGTSITLYGAVFYTNSADRASAESYASTNWVPGP